MRTHFLVEGLESRSLLTVMVLPAPSPVLGADHVSRVTGSQGADRIVFTRIVAGGTDAVKVCQCLRTLLLRQGGKFAVVG